MRIITLALAGTAVLTLSACTGGGAENNQASAANTAEAALENQAEAVENAAENATGAEKPVLENAADSLREHGGESEGNAAGGKPGADGAEGGDGQKPS